MKLTNTIRDAFIRAAMDDVPKIAYDDQQRKLITDDAIAQLPPKVRAIYNDTNLRYYLNTNYAYKFSSVNVPCVSSDKYAPKEITLKEYDRLQALKEAQETSLTVLRNKLRGCAYACSTRKALVTMLPEFEKYLPADEVAACRTLPVVANVVADFVRAGWPKGSKKAKQATA